jgi:hypothetical protein
MGRTDRLFEIIDPARWAIEVDPDRETAGAVF